MIKRESKGLGKTACHDAMALEPGSAELRSISVTHQPHLQWVCLTSLLYQEYGDDQSDLSKVSLQSEVMFA